LSNPYYLLGFTLGTIRRETVILPVDKTNPKSVASKRPEGLAPDQSGMITEVGLLRLGPAAIAIIPGELYPELAVGGLQTPQDPNADFPGAPHEPLLFDQVKDAKYKLVFGLSNDMLGYLIPKSQWDKAAPFCYGRKTAQYGEDNSCGPDAAVVICRAFRKLAQGR
jgi:hypothetical protein